MNRKALLVIAAVLAAAAIVVLTTGAFAGTAGRSDQPGDGFAALVSCLAAHGVQVPSDDPAAVKQWLADHYKGDPAVQAALEACAGEAKPGAGKKGSGEEPGPTAAEFVACLERHGVVVPSDAKETPGAFKQWVVEAVKQPSVSAAVEECAGGHSPNGRKKK